MVYIVISPHRHVRHTQIRCPARNRGSRRRRRATSSTFHIRHSGEDSRIHHRIQDPRGCFAAIVPSIMTFVSFTNYTTAAQKRTLLATNLYQREFVIKMHPRTGRIWKALGCDLRLDCGSSWMRPVVYGLIRFKSGPLDSFGVGGSDADLQRNLRSLWGLGDFCVPT
jgi:hypothetical protein